MSHRGNAVAIGAALLAVVLSSAALAGKAKPKAAKKWLLRPAPAVDANARGLVDWKLIPAKGAHAERSWLRLRIGRLDGTAYTLWIDDPGTTGVVDLIQVASATAAPLKNGQNYFDFRLDTKRGDTLPFGAALAALYGKALEIRDSEGRAVLAGIVPNAPKPKPKPGGGGGGGYDY